MLQRPTELKQIEACNTEESLYKRIQEMKQEKTVEASEEWERRKLQITSAMTSISPVACSFHFSNASVTSCSDCRCRSKDHTCCARSWSSADAFSRVTKQSTYDCCCDGEGAVESKTAAATSWAGRNGMQHRM